MTRLRSCVLQLCLCSSCVCIGILIGRMFDWCSPGQCELYIKNCIFPFNYFLVYQSEMMGDMFGVGTVVVFGAIIVKYEAENISFIILTRTIPL